MTFSFTDLNLKGVEAAAGFQNLKPGTYIVRVEKAELMDTASGGKRLRVRLVQEGGSASVLDSINLYLPGKEEATRIGLSQLKGLLVNGGHADPDAIGEHGIASIQGLVTGVSVGQETYDGQVRSKVTAYIPVSEVKTAPTTSSTTKIGVEDDDIPF